MNTALLSRFDQLKVNDVSSIHGVPHVNEYVKIQLFSPSSVHINVHIKVQTNEFSFIVLQLSVKSVGAAFISFIEIVNCFSIINHPKSVDCTNIL